MSGRRGSFLLFSVALVGVMVVFAYALLQTVRLSTDAGTSSQRQWFAQEAAVAGLHHAMENIALDYRSGHRSATYLDGIWHRDFYPIGLDQNQPESAPVAADDDVRNENILWKPILERNDRGYWEYGNGYGSFGQNMYQSNGRARYFEVGYYEPSDPTYVSRSSMTATRFTHAAAPVPARAKAIFLDAQLRRLEPASGETADSLRQRARYRLRYAVLTKDASSELLINPALDVDYRDAWRPGDGATTVGGVPGDDTYANAYDKTDYNAHGSAYAPTPLGRRLERYGHSLINMMAASGNAGERGNYFRLEHIFKLRGVANNVAISPQGWPVAFPNMLRYLEPSGSTYKSSESQHISTAPFASGLGLYISPFGVVRLEGGQSARGHADDDTGIGLSHALVGPQYSYRNLQTAVRGHNIDRDWSEGDPAPTRSMLTPFGRAGGKGTVANASQWNHGPTDVPWQINPLTAGSGVISAMIGGYMPAQFRCLITKIRVSNLDATGTTVLSVSDVPSASIPSASRGDDSFYDSSRFGSYARDLFTDFLSPAFWRYPAPTGEPQSPTGSFNLPPYANIVITGQPTTLYPNFTALDPRAPDKVYPGVYASLSISAPVTAMEDTGRLLNASEAYCERSSGYDRVMAYDSHSTQMLFVGPHWRKPNNTTIREPVAGNLLVRDSFFWDMSCAFSTAVSVLRMHWLEVSNLWCDLPTLFPDGRSTYAIDSLAAFDRLFLQQLGIDMAAPASTTPIASWGFDGVPSSYPRSLRRGKLTLNYTIAGLVAADLLKTASYSSVQRARCMELMLNDWRMSFLGASPDYPDFRPLDFDGDGYALCSAYATSYRFADDAAGVTWPAVPADVATRRGRALISTDCPFSLTGCFVMRKSRYYRVITRGELWDCQLGRPVSNATMESILCVDPNGRSSVGKLGDDVAVLHQRWYWNSYNALLPSIYP